MLYTIVSFIETVTQFFKATLLIKRYSLSPNHIYIYIYIYIIHLKVFPWKLHHFFWKKLMPSLTVVTLEITLLNVVFKKHFSVLQASQEGDGILSDQIGSAPVSATHKVVVPKPGGTCVLFLVTVIFTCFCSLWKFENYYSVGYLYCLDLSVGFCLKFKDDTKGEKIFINVCQADNVSVINCSMCGRADDELLFL